MRYADLEAHHDLGLGAEEPDTRRFTRPSDRMATKPVDSHVTEGDPSGMDLDSMFDAIEDGRRSASGEDLIRTGALDALERRIAHHWEVWEGLTDGQSRTNLAAFIHSMEDRADQLKEHLNRGNTAPPTTEFLAGQVIEGECTTQKEK